MTFIQMLIFVAIAAALRSQREKINVPTKFKESYYSKMKWQQWINPSLSWTNKKSKYWLWQKVKSGPLVMFTDLKHCLGVLQLNCYIVPLLLLTEMSLSNYIVAWVIHGVIFEWFSLDFFVTPKSNKNGTDS